MILIFKTGDLSDFSGIAGPVIGTIAAFMPQARIIKVFSTLLGGRQPNGKNVSCWYCPS